MPSQNGNAHCEVGVCVLGRQPEAALQNVHLDYTPLADLVHANIEGQRQALKFLADIQSHFADPDALYLALKSAMSADMPAECLATVRGFARVVQKHLEAEAP